MEKVLIEDYLNLKKKIEEIKERKQNLESEVREFQNEKIFLESANCKIRQNKDSISKNLKVNKKLKFYQCAEKKKYKISLMEEFERIDIIENQLISKYGIKTSQEIILYLNNIDKELERFKRYVASLNVELLKSENALKYIEGNLNLEYVESALDHVLEECKGITMNLEILRLRKRLLDKQKRS